MRNLVVARDPAAQGAGAEVVAAGGNALDAVVAGALAGATAGSSAALLGAGVVLLAGPGVGQWFVDGRARAPGLGERRPRSADAPPPSWGAAVPGLLEGLFAAHARFGSMALSALVRTTVGVLKESDPDDAVRARIKVLQQLTRGGLTALERTGLAHAVAMVAGPLAGGMFTREDLAPTRGAVSEARVLAAGDHELVLPPVALPPPRHAPPRPPDVPVEAVVCADMHGVMACAAWAVAPAAVALPDVPGLALAGLIAPSARGVPRWRPGATLPFPLPLALARHEGRVWAGLAVAGKGALDAARDRALAARLGAVGIEAELPPSEAGAVSQGVALWIVREAGDEVRGTITAA